MKKVVYIKSEAIQEKLNVLLSDYQIHYQNLRAFHWLVKGPLFYQMHARFEEFYNDAAATVDELAERILMIGGKPLHSFEDYLKHAELKAHKNLSKASDILPVVVSENEHLLASAREILSLASESNDEGTVALASELISGLEKKLWMLNSLAE